MGNFCSSKENSRVRKSDHKPLYPLVYNVRNKANNLPLAPLSNREKLTYMPYPTVYHYQMPVERTKPQKKIGYQPYPTVYHY